MKKSWIIVFLSVLLFSGYVVADDCKRPHGFSINEAGDQVWFAPGNLQYQASTNTWRFAERQFDRCGDGIEGNTTVYYTDGGGNRKLCNNNDASETYAGWIDIFGWGTSGYKGSNPWMKHDKDADYGPAKGGFYVISGDNRNYDWGYYNEIYEGTRKYPRGTWRTPTEAEWRYVLYTRKVNGQAAYSIVDLKYDPAAATMFGYILYPDDFSFTQAGIPPIASGESYNTTISLSTWEALEREGCVFLPATCHRENGVYPFTEVNHIWHTPWSSLTPSWFPSDGLPVRLVRDRIVTQNDVIACSETYRWNLGYKTISISAPGEYYDTLRSVEGCDSIISHLLLSAASAIKRDTFVKILAGETFTWNVTKQSYSKSGTYHDTLRNACGWDIAYSRLFLKVIDPCASDVHPFTINEDGDKVIFSPGNLQYKPSTKTWRFAEHQYAFIGEKDNLNVTPSSDFWIDLFAWGTSGKGTIPERSDPLAISSDVGIGPAEGSFDVNSGDNRSYDWGYLNEIYEGDTKHPLGTWRTPTGDEWEYLIKQKISLVRISVTMAGSDEVYGLILYPDDFEDDILPNGTLITTTEWSALEAEGCAFLPVAGYESTYSYNKEISSYWGATRSVGGNYYHALFLESENVWKVSMNSINYNLSVRLVRDVTDDDEYDDDGAKIISDIIDTLRCGNTYTWDLGYKLREITQTEEEKEYEDELEADCGKLVSKLKLVRKPLVADTKEITKTICAGDKYTWDLGYTTRELDRENDYYDTLRCVQGCDSVISILHLNVKRPIDDDYTGVIHCGETYEWDYGYGKTNKWDYGSGDEDLAKPGVYSLEKKNTSSGCVEKISTLHLMFSADDVEFTEKEDVIYEGEKYTWKLSDGREREFDTEGDYYDTIREGTCDKTIAHLKLALTAKSAITSCAQHPFTINSSGDQVIISSGNLQYQASTNTWRFAPNQYDNIGIDNQNISETYDGWIDLFGWGTSGKGTDVSRSYPWAYDVYASYGPDGAFDIDVNSGDNRSYDWGYLNEIYDGETKYPHGIWRTLTIEEWNYLLTTRQVNGASGYSWVSYSGVNGLLLYPDDFTFDKAGISSIPVGGEISTNLTSAQWAALEEAHCIFLPQTAYRIEKNIRGADGNEASYWSSSCEIASHAQTVYLRFSYCEIQQTGMDRAVGMAVRLVKDYRDRAIVKDFNGTVIRGESYDWTLDDGRTISIPPQKEDEKDYYDTLIIACDSIISHLKLVLKDVEDPCAQHPFTINSSGDQVIISSGNLQYQASTNTWRFAPNQYDDIGIDNQNISETYDGWIDLFGWGTSGKGTDVSRSYPWAYDVDASYGPDGAFDIDVNSGDNRSYDWGYLNEIYDDETKYPPGIWRTLTIEEWNYLLTTRQVNGALGYSWVSYSGVNGLLLYPDDFTFDKAGISSIPVGGEISTNLTSAQWAALEEAHCIFLPQNAYRIEKRIRGADGDEASYWSSSCGSASHAQTVYLRFSYCEIQQTGMNRAMGMAVRLVKDYRDRAIVKNFNGTVIRGESYDWTLDDGRTISIPLQKEDEKDYYDTLIIACDSIISHLKLVLKDVEDPCAQHPFTINSSGDQVIISSGNLQYQASTNTWRFAPNQYDTMGTGNRYLSDTYEGWIDLFGWGTSGYNGCNPWLSSMEVNDYGPATHFDVNSGDNRNYDWGYYNEIQNGTTTDPKGTWRTLTFDEWQYLLNTRRVDGATGYSWITINYGSGTSNGLLLYPEDFSFANVGLERIPIGSSTSTTIENDTWQKLEEAGCIFLPVAGNRRGKSVGSANDRLSYWSSNIYETNLNSANYMQAYFDTRTFQSSNTSRYYGFSVRLVKDFDGESVIRKNKIDTIYRGDSYEWELDNDRKIPITQTEDEKHYYDTVRSKITGCDSIVSHLLLLVEDKPEYNPCAPHPFTINADGGQVFISSGNLQYQATTDTWRFAERQFDRVADGQQAVMPSGSEPFGTANRGLGTVLWDSAGYRVPCSNAFTSKTYGGWIDLFPWGTSGHGQKVGDKYACNFAPYSYSADEVNETYNRYGYGPSFDSDGSAGVWGTGALSNNIDTNSGTNRYFDWGYANTIHEKDTAYKPGTWRTLTADEWTYLLNTRIVDSNDSAFSFVRVRYGSHPTDTVTGTLLYPDDFSFAKVGVAAIPFGARYVLTEIDAAIWSVLEKAGVIFLPSAGMRGAYDASNNVFSMVQEHTYGSRGSYHTATALGANNSHIAYFDFEDRYQNISNTDRYFAYPVRLVRDVEIITKDTIDTLLCGGTYSWKLSDGSIRKLDTEGEYYDTLKNICGNDSVIFHLYLQKKLQVIHKDTTDTLRCGNDYTWVLYDSRTIPINQTEKEKEHFDTVIVGCDSIISHLKLVIEPIKATIKDTSITICKGDSYSWDWATKPRQLDVAGEYYDTIRSVQKCDSIIWHLTLAIAGEHTTKDTTITICKGDSYSWDWATKPRQLDVAGEYYDTIRSIHKCDSIIWHLTLDVSDLIPDERPTTATIERGESYEWKITETKTRYITTQGDHRDTVRSMYGCDSIISILTLTVTSTEPYDEPVYDTICNKNDYEWIRERTKIKDISQTTEKGTYRDTIRKKVNGKDSIYCILYLTRLETKTKPTNVTVCLGERYDWYTTDRLAPHLSILVEGDYSNQQTIPFKNYSGCDSIIYTLNIIAKDCHNDKCVPLTKLDFIRPDVCADSISFNYMLKYVAGKPSTYSVKFDTKARTNGFVNIEGHFEPENIFDTYVLLPINIPQKEPFIRPWSYEVQLNITDTCGVQHNFTDSLHIFYPSKIVGQHWNDVLAVLNSGYNGGYEFSAYQWYENDEPIYGATHDHCHFPANLSETSKYQVLLTRSDDGHTTFTCPVKVVPVEDKNLLNEPYVYVHPTMVSPEHPVIQIQSNLDGSYWVYDMSGKLIRSGDFAAYSDKHGATRVSLPPIQSAYLVYLIPKDKKHIKEKSYIVIVR